MKMKSILLTSFVLIVTSAASAQVTRICGKVHEPLDAFSASIYRMFYGAGPVISTTTTRAEVKFVNKSEVLNAKVEELQSSGDYILRDIAEPGTVNVTVTDYMPIAHFTLDGGKFAVKVRFRKYYVREASDVNGLNMKPISKMKTISKIEFKIDHPNYKGMAVNKQVLNISDADIALITKKSAFLKHQDAILERMKQLNPGQDALIEKFMTAFSARYKSDQAYKQGLFVRTQYDRKSLQRMLVSKKRFYGQKMDAQITLDENIRLFDLIKGVEIRPYADDVIVVENKTPIPFAGFTKDDLIDTPELSLVQDFVEFADKNHLDEYEKNAGKMSKIARKADKKLKKAASQHEADLQDVANDLE